MATEPETTVTYTVHPGDGSEHIVVREDPDGLGLVQVLMVDVDSTVGEIQMHRKTAHHVAKALVLLADQLERAEEGKAEGTVGTTTRGWGEESQDAGLEYFAGAGRQSK